MDKEALGKLWSKLGKFKYPLMIFVLGVGLMLIPTKEEPQTAEPVTEVQSFEDPLAITEEKLATLLAKAQGVGRVEVMLQYESGEQTVYQTDLTQETRQSGEESQSQTDSHTVLEGDDTPVVVQTIYPVFSGALVVADGGDDPQVRLNLVNAVSSLTGLGADKITVIKMKSN